MPELTPDDLKATARDFAKGLSEKAIRELYGVTDGKAVGTHVEHAFHGYLKEQYAHTAGSSASGIDFPDLGVDLKVTSIEQPQSSCPYRDASEKVYGLGYHLIVFVYRKEDDVRAKAARLKFEHVVFVDQQVTADFQTTKGLNGIVDRGGNKEDIVAFLEERNLPLDEIGREALAERILKQRPRIG